MGGSRSHSDFVCVENCTKIAINKYWYFGVVYHVYSVCTYSCTLLKVVGYYDSSVLSMSVMDFQKKCGCELYPIFFLHFF